MAAQIIGWICHISNGATFGVMYVALIGNARPRSWIWAMLFATGLELGMLHTPYPNVFDISLTAGFVVVTMSAHAIFGVVLGKSTNLLSRLRMNPTRGRISPAAG